ncbi:MAG TPA: hypothetical protein VMD59_06795 [Acidimicrobiales bacterium]|nr:hypothetical protein [Acidimicrobiales bacterium]
MSFASARVGFVTKACDPGLGLLQTTDGGRDWRRADLERPPGGWPEYAQLGLPTVTADGAVLESASGLDRATDEDGWLVVERRSSAGSFRYLGRVQTDGLMTTAVDAIDATGSRLALLAAGRLPAEGDELFESSDGGVSWRLAGHEAVEGGGVPTAGTGAPALGEDAAVAVLPQAGKQPAARSAHGPVVGALLLDASPADAEGQDAGGAIDWTSDSGRSWKQALGVAPQPPAVSPYDDIAFASARLGYLAGPAGVAVTTDGGERVTPVLRLGGGEQVLRLEATGRSSAVVVTTHRLLVTADGGRRWQARSEPSDLAADAAAAEVRAIDFVSPRVGFVSSCSDRPGAAALERTLDGGRSWQPLAVPAGSRCVGSPLSLCVASSRVLYDLVPPAVAANDVGSAGPLDATLYASNDGGDSWRRVGPAPDSLLACSGSTLWAEAYAGAAMGFEPYVVFRSGDGGRSFAAVAGTVAKTARFGDFGGPYPAMTLTNGELDTLTAFGAGSAVLTTDCWACQPGFDLTVSVTTDGGSAWSGPDDVLAAGLSDSPQWVSFVSSRVGFVIGTWSQGCGDVLVATSDGGGSWRQLAVLGAGS